MSEWIKFSDQYPNYKNKAIWITDCKTFVEFKLITLINSYPEYSKQHPDHYWKDCPVPEIPKHELHLCIDGPYPHNPFKMICEEDEDGALWTYLVFPWKTDRVNFDQGHRYEVFYCPTCGYKSKASTSLQAKE